MKLPDRNANSSDSVISPYRDQPQSAETSFNTAEWLTWRLTDPDLAGDLREIMVAEAYEARQLGNLLSALAAAPGKDLEAKMRNPIHRAILRSLSLRWLRAQRVLVDLTTNSLDRRASGNGH
jgi:hypothetical protein